MRKSSLVATTLAVTLSLAGRTATPAPQGVPVRVGGFGGSKGLAQYLAAERINVLIDATHPYAAVMSDSAARAAELIDVRLLALRRPAWAAVAGDRWTEVADAQHAVHGTRQAAAARVSRPRPPGTRAVPAGAATPLSDPQR